MRIAVVGAGVIGITSAVAIKEAFPAAEVTVFADAFSPETTGDGSAGFWGPYILANTDPQKIMRWSLITHKWMESFWKSDLAADLGASLIPVYRVTSDPSEYPVPVWAPVVHGAHELSKNELERLNKKNKKAYSGGLHFLTYTFEPVRFLPWLMDKFKQMNGKIVKRKITDLKKLKEEGYDVVINCTGMGSRELLGDHTIIPVRGQVSRVKAPWMFESFLEEDDDGNYVIPNIESVILGGTHQEGDFDVYPRKEDSKFIHEGCERIYPSLNKCVLLKEWVGLRPGRQVVRLEPEIIRSSGNKDLLIIHNYGHGGSGITLCWGCALDVVEILRQQEKIKTLSKL